MVDLMDLQIFADGTAGATASAAAGSAGGVAAPDMQAQSAETGSPAMSNNAPQTAGQTEDVREGMQPDQGATQQQPTQTTESQRIAFDDLISGDYKQDYEQKIQSVINDRLKGSKAREAKVAPLLQAIAEQYGLEADDIDGIASAFLEDPARYEQQALEQGVSPETAARLARLKRMEAERSRAEAAAKKEEAIKQHFAGLQKQEAEMQQLYPGFDLQRELTDPMFFKLTSQDVGLTLKQAWQAMHGEEIAAAGMQYALERGQAKVAASVQANMNRPSEGGIRRTPATGVKLDPTKMTDAERADLKRRVNAGEKVYL